MMNMSIAHEYIALAVGDFECHKKHNDTNNTGAAAARVRTSEGQYAHIQHSFTKSLCSISVKCSTHLSSRQDTTLQNWSSHQKTNSAGNWSENDP